MTSDRGKKHPLFAFLRPESGSNDDVVLPWNEKKTLIDPQKRGDDLKKRGNDPQKEDNDPLKNR